MKLTQKPNIMLLLLILLFTIITFTPYIRLGEYSPGMMTSDTSRFSIGIQEIIESKYLDYTPDEGIARTWLERMNYPPGFAIILIAIRGLTSLDTHQTELLFHFIYLILFVLSSYLFSYMLTENKFISLLSVFFITTFRNAIDASGHLQSFFLNRPSSLMYAVIPLIFVCLYYYLFRNNKYIIPYFLLMSLTYITHQRTSVFMTYIIFLFLIIMWAVHKERYVKRISVAFLATLFAIAISSIWWLRSGFVKNSIIDQITGITPVFSKILYSFSGNIYYIVFVAIITICILSLTFKKYPINNLYSNPTFNRITPLVIISYLIIFWTTINIWLRISVLVCFLILYNTNVAYRIKNISNDKLNKPFHLFSYLIIIAYFVWLIITITNFEGISNIYTGLYGEEINTSIFLFLNMGLGHLPFAFFGLYYLTKTKTDYNKKLLIIFINIIILLNYSRIIDFGIPIQKTVPLITIFLSVVASAGVYYLVKRLQKSKCVTLTLILLVITLSSVPAIEQSINTIQGRGKWQDIIYSVKWLEENIDNTEIVTGDKYSIRAAQIFTRLDVANRIEFDAVKMYRTLELTDAFTSKEPGKVIPLMMIYDSKFLILNKDGLRKNYFASFWPDIPYHEIMDSIKRRFEEMYGEKKNYIIRDNINKDLFSSESLVYDDSEFLNKIYAAGHSSIYQLNTNKLPRPSNLKEDIDTGIEISAISIPEVSYLTDDSKKVRINVINKLDQDEDITLETEIKDPFDSIIGQNTLSLSLPSKSQIKRDIKFHVSKYYPEGYYSITIKLIEENYILDKEKIHFLLKQHPIIKVGDGILNTIIVGKKTKFAYPAIENRANKSIDILYQIVLKSENSRKKFTKNITFEPKETKRVNYLMTFNESEVFQVEEYMKSDFGMLRYDFNRSIHIIDPKKQ